MEVKEIKKKLKKSLDKQRYQHTLGVMYTAGCLAMANGYSIEKAMLAGLLHDCAKCLSTEKKIGLCVKKNIDITEVEISNPGLLHAKAGMVLAEEEYGIKDAQILHAILQEKQIWGSLTKYSLWQIILSQTDVKHRGLKR